MSLEIKRKELELMRVKTARHELEFKVDEKTEEINKLKEHIKIQLETEDRLEKEIEQLKGK